LRGDVAMSVVRLRAIVKMVNDDVVKEAFISKVVTLGYVEPLLPDEVFKYYPLSEYDYRLDSTYIEYIVDNAEEVASSQRPFIGIWLRMSWLGLMFLVSIGLPWMAMP